MIYGIMTAYFVAWWLVFWQLPSKDSPLRFLAFIPAFVLAFAVPGVVWESTVFPVSVQFALLIGSGCLPFILAGAIWWWKRRKRNTSEPSPHRIPHPRRVRNPVRRDVGVKENG